MRLYNHERTGQCLKGEKYVYIVEVDGIIRSIIDKKGKAIRLAELGFICEVRGWDDMRANKMTISVKEGGEEFNADL